MKAKTIPQTLKEFIAQDQFNALFVYTALNRYAEHVMTLRPEDHERSVISLNLVQEIAKDWQQMTQEPIKAKIGEAQKI
jgi:hypothetical protein